MTDHILEFWSSQAEKFGTDHTASWGDRYAIDLEIDAIGKYIKEGHAVLDVGCANGYSAIRHLDKKVASMVGVDFSEPMIREARKNHAKVGAPKNVRFDVADIRSLPLDDNSFDVVYTTRVLINLPTWDQQKQGISECIRVCRPGGVVVLSEGFWEPLMILNAMRALVALAPLVEHDFNRYLKKSRLEAFLRERSIEYENVDFSSVYYLGSRFVRELVTNPADYPGYSNPINGIFYNIEKEYSGGGFGIQQIYALKKGK